MFPKDKRLSKDKEFDLVFKKGRSSYDQILGIRTLKTDSTINRFGIIVSNKVSKKAVERNQVKRRIRAILQKNKFRISGIDVVVIALPAIMQKDYAEIENSIKQQLKRLNLIN